MPLIAKTTPGHLTFKALQTPIRMAGDAVDCENNRGGGESELLQNNHAPGKHARGVVVVVLSEQSSVTTSSWEAWRRTAQRTERREAFEPIAVKR